MTILFLSHSDCERHVMLAHHPESPLRLSAINQALSGPRWDVKLSRQQASEIHSECFQGIHPAQYLNMLAELRPGDGIVQIDPDTSLNQYSLRAAKLAAGAGVQAVEALLCGQHRAAFCAVRPPGHHAEAAIGMGFCIFNNIALAAERALSLGAQRVAILDFDVHHGNGTVDIFQDRPEVLVCSSFQHPFYPGRYTDIDRPNIILTPLPEASSGSDFRLAIERDWLPALDRHQPDLILVSAGFDAHREDPLGGLLLDDSDYAWLGQLLQDEAQTRCNGRLLSMLEGGYNTEALARSVQQYLGAQAQ